MIIEQMKEKLDKLIGKLEHTFQTAEFKQNQFNEKDWFIWESKLDYNISKYLFDKSGRPDEEALDYIRKKTGWEIFARQRDGLGWYVGNIYTKDPIDGKEKTILFG